MIVIFFLLFVPAQQPHAPNVGSLTPVASVLNRPRRRAGPSPTPFAAGGIDSSVVPRGQLTDSSPFGRALARLAGLPDVELFLETGTFFGGGSSLCIARALKAKGSGRLVTIESFAEPHAYAARTLRGYPVELLLGTAISQVWRSEALRRSLRKLREGLDLHARSRALAGGHI